MLRRRTLLRGTATLGVGSALPLSMGLALEGCATTTTPSAALGTITVSEGHGLAFDVRGLRWTLTPSAGRVDVWDETSARVASFGDLGRPATIATDATGLAWVVDVEGARIVALDLDRGVVAELTGPLRGPRDIAFDEAGRLHVADALAHQIVRFAPNGSFDLSLGTPVTNGTDEGALNGPRSLDFAHDGTLLVAEVGARRVSRLDASGAWLETVTGDVSAPRSLRVGADGRFAVADSVLRRVVVHDRAGDATTVLPLEAAPVSVAFGTDGRLWVQAT